VKRPIPSWAAIEAQIGRSPAMAVGENSRESWLEFALRSRLLLASGQPLGERQSIRRWK